MLNNFKFSIIIPCYNEEKGLRAILRSIPSIIDEVIVVDNGSKDNTIQLAKSYKAKVVIENVRGYGRALQSGLSQIGNSDIIGIIDGDGSYHIECFLKMYKYMEDSNFDFVSGCRLPLTNLKAMPFINILSNYFISWLTRFLFKINIIDSQSGMMIFKKDILKRIKIYNTGMGFSQEIKVKSWLNRQIKCSEFKINYYPRIGKAKFNKLKDSINNLYDILILWIRIKNEKINY